MFCTVQSGELSPAVVIFYCFIRKCSWCTRLHLLFKETSVQLCVCVCMEKVCNLISVWIICLRAVIFIQPENRTMRLRLALKKAVNKRAGFMTAVLKTDDPEAGNGCRKAAHVLILVLRAKSLLQVLLSGIWKCNNTHTHRTKRLLANSVFKKSWNVTMERLNKPFVQHKYTTLRYGGGQLAQLPP